MRVTRLWIGALAACGSHAVPPSHREPPYLVLFAADRSWTLRGAAGDSATCRVAGVSRLGDSSVAHVVCAKPHDDLGIVGWWVAAPAGLYHPVTQPENPDELAALSEDDLLLNAQPEERHHAVSLGEVRETIDAVPFNSGWCTSTEATNGALRRGWTLCLDDRQVIGVADFVEAPGAPPIDARFGALPSADETD